MSDINSKMLEIGEEVNRFIAHLVDSNHDPRMLYRAAVHLINAGGKRLRPFMVVKSCRLVGGSMKEAIPAAVAVEILHTFTLIHDDIMDRDTLRRGVETVHVKWGVPIAILSGDLLFAKVFEVISDSYAAEPKKAIEILKLLCEVTVQICEGQTLDMSFESRRNISEEEYLEMISKKTAKLLEVSARIGGIVGGGDPQQLEALTDFGYNAGMAFQIIDDILGLMAVEEELGKPVGSDLREGKMTLIIIHALNNASPSERKVLLDVLGKESASKSEINRAVEVINALGSIEYARKIAERYASESKEALSSFKDCDDKRDLIELVDLILSRRR